MPLPKPFLSTLGHGEGDISRRSSVPISALQVLMPHYPGYVLPALNDDSRSRWPVGLARQAAQPNQLFAICSSGEMEDPFWDWIPGTPIWLGDGAIATQGPHSGSHLIILGVALTPTRILVRIGAPILLG